MRLRIYRLDHKNTPYMDFYNRRDLDLAAAVRNLGRNHNNYVYYAMHRGVVVGLYAIRFSGTRYRILTSDGTVVIPSYQKYGVASKLWTRAIKDFKPKGIHVSLISDRGHTLVRKMQEKFPRIKWHTCCSAGRGLRDLRRKKAA